MSEWTLDEKIEYFLHFTKAEKICPQVRKVFNLCRAMPFGQTIDPEICFPHAMNLVDCFEDSRSSYPPCHDFFLKAKECLKAGTSTFVSFEKCEGEVEAYANCFHPALNKYSKYEEQFQ
jgi:hypothetical protein